MRKWLVLVAVLSLVFTGVTEFANESNVRYADPTVTTSELNELQSSILKSKNELADLEASLLDLEIRHAETARIIATVNTTNLVSRGGTRNYFVTLDLNKPSGLTAEQYDIMLEDTPLYSYGWIFEKAEKEEGVNGLFLMALTGAEQSFGAANTGLKSKYNLTSWNAADGKTHLATSFDSYWDCIQTTAASLKKNYLTKGGKYYNGVTVVGVNKKYASDKEWAYKIANIMQTRIKKLN